MQAKKHRGRGVKRLPVYFAEPAPNPPRKAPRKDAAKKRRPKKISKRQFAEAVAAAWH